MEYDQTYHCSKCQIYVKDRTSMPTSSSNCGPNNSDHKWEKVHNIECKICSLKTFRGPVDLYPECINGKAHDFKEIHY